MYSILDTTVFFSNSKLFTLLYLITAVSFLSITLKQRKAVGQTLQLPVRYQKELLKLFLCSCMYLEESISMQGRLFLSILSTVQVKLVWTLSSFRMECKADWYLSTGEAVCSFSQSLLALETVPVLVWLNTVFCVSVCVCVVETWAVSLFKSVFLQMINSMIILVCTCSERVPNLAHHLCPAKL